MAKALLGTHLSPRAAMLIDEVRVLRARVAQLETALAESQSARDDHVLELADQVLELDAPQKVSA
jgi:hypothetical protein